MIKQHITLEVSSYSLTGPVSFSLSFSPTSLRQNNAFAAREIGRGFEPPDFSLICFLITSWCFFLVGCYWSPRGSQPPRLWDVWEQGDSIAGPQGACSPLPADSGLFSVSILVPSPRKHRERVQNCETFHIFAFKNLGKNSACYTGQKTVGG